MPAATFPELADILFKFTRLDKETAIRWSILCQMSGITPELAQQVCVLCLTNELPIADVLGTIRHD